MRRLLAFLIFAVIIFAVYLGFATLSRQEANSAVVYFYRHDKLYPAKRSIDEDPKELIALTELFDGPTAAEKKLNIQTMLPPQLDLQRMVFLENGVLELWLNEELLKISGGYNAINGMLKQIVFTATQIRGINSVSFRVNEITGNKLVIGGEGYIIDRPLDQAYFEGKY